MFYTSISQPTQIDFDSARKLSADGDSVLGPGGYENIVVRKEAQESSAQTRISEKVARGELHTLERNVCYALLDQNQQFQATVREHQRRARDAAHQPVQESSVNHESIFIQGIQTAQGRYEERHEKN